MAKSSKVSANGDHVEFEEMPAQRRLEGPKLSTDNGLCKAILEALGRPDDLSRVDLKRLHSGKHYRVNVYRCVKNDIRITDSFYITVSDNAEKIISSNPEIKKKYYDADLEILSKSHH